MPQNIKHIPLQIEGGESLEWPIGEAEYECLMNLTEAKFGKRPTEISFIVRPEATKDETEKLVYENRTDNNKWVCELCYPGVKEIGEIADGFWLAFFEGKYIIVGYNGHRDKWSFVFEDKPTPNPDPQNQPCPTCGKENTVTLTDLQAGYRCDDCPDELTKSDDNDPLLKESIAWLNRIDYFGKWLVPVSVGYDFMRSCIETGGWDDQNEYKIFDQWLYDKAGRLIQEWENAQKVPSDGSVG